jgi:hypothetical protein
MPFSTARQVLPTSWKATHSTSLPAAAIGSANASVEVLCSEVGYEIGAAHILGDFPGDTVAVVHQRDDADAVPDADAAVASWKAEEHFLNHSLVRPMAGSD